MLVNKNFFKRVNSCMQWIEKVELLLNLPLSQKGAERAGILLDNLFGEFKRLEKDNEEADSAIKEQIARIEEKMASLYGKVLDHSMDAKINEFIVASASTRKKKEVLTLKEKVRKFLKEYRPSSQQLLKLSLMLTLLPVGFQAATLTKWLVMGR